MRMLTLMLTAVLAGSAPAAEWEAVSAGLAKTEKAGYGGLCGVLVDRSTGHVYLNVSDKGLYRSEDAGKSWKAFAAPFKGRTEWPGCMAFGPGGKLVVALVYGSPILVGSTKGEPWKVLDAKSGHVDWFAGDWADPDMKFLVALKHEANGLLLATHDGGKTFAEKGKGFAAAWVFDAKTAVAAEAKTKDTPKPGLKRTTDGGETWTPCGDYTTQALPKPHGDKLYWLVDGALLTTTDKGATWEKAGAVKDGKYGPVFGKDAKTMFVLTKDGVIESADGGATWGKPISLPKELKGWSALTWLEYDPVGDYLYVMKMTSELWRMKR